MRPRKFDAGFARLWRERFARGEPRHRGDTRPHRRKPDVERLEARDLPSSLPLAHAAAHAGQRAAAATVDSAESPHRSAGSGTLGYYPAADGLLGAKPPQRFLDPKVIQQSVELLYTGPNATTPMTPTPREVLRQIFTASWIGEYIVGPPTFSDRASTIYFHAVKGGSNAFLKGKFQMVLYPPADPDATPTPGDPYANQTVGLANLINQNFLETGGMLVLNINTTPGLVSNTGSLPTHLTWTYDTASGGTFTAPAGFTQGTGTLDIKYLPDRVPLPGTRGSGTMIVEFQGLINYSQLISATSKVYS
jgi:hypothetical protein